MWAEDFDEETEQEREKQFRRLHGPQNYYSISAGQIGKFLMACFGPTMIIPVFHSFYGCFNGEKMPEAVLGCVVLVSAIVTLLSTWFYGYIEPTQVSKESYERNDGFFMYESPVEEEEGSDVQKKK